MIIGQIREKIKQFSEKTHEDGGIAKILLTFLVILVAFLSFGLGLLSGSEGAESSSVVVRKPQNTVFSNASEETEASTRLMEANKEIKGSSKEERKFVASQNGTRFYLPWCGGVSRINEENKVWFSTEKEARDFGLTPAKNCEGI